jgi:hypothetical protein
MGEEYTLVLCIEGRNRPDPPAARLSLPPVPPMTIMEALAPEGDDELLSFRLIPLEGPFFTFPSFPFPLETQTFPVPALRIPVNPAPAAPAEEPESAPLPELPEETPVPERVSPPFPSPPPEGPGFSRRLQERIRSLWEAGQIVEALAELRRNERDHPAGFTLVGYRRALEQTLGLEEEPAERYAPPILLVPALVLCLLLAALSFTLPAALAWVPLRVFRWAGFFFGVVALLCLLRLGLGYHLSVSYGGRPPRRALAREAVVYRVPDDRGTEIARLKEGQGLLVYEVRDGWAYAESLVNGRTGWIRTGTYLIY